MEVVAEKHKTEGKKRTSTVRERLVHLSDCCSIRKEKGVEDRVSVETDCC